MDNSSDLLWEISCPNSHGKKQLILQWAISASTNLWGICLSNTFLTLKYTQPIPLHTLLTTFMLGNANGNTTPVTLESQNHEGWKRPLRSWSPTVNPTPPCLLNDVLKCHIYMFFEYLQGWWLQGKVKGHKFWRHFSLSEQLKWNLGPRLHISILKLFPDHVISINSAAQKIFISLRYSNHGGGMWSSDYIWVTTFPNEISYTNTMWAKKKTPTCSAWAVHPVYSGNQEFCWRTAGISTGSFLAFTWGIWNSCPKPTWADGFALLLTSFQHHFLVHSVFPFLFLCFLWCIMCSFSPRDSYCCTGGFSRW